MHVGLVPSLVPRRSRKKGEGAPVRACTKSFVIFTVNNPNTYLDESDYVEITSTILRTAAYWFELVEGSVS